MLKLRDEPRFVHEHLDEVGVARALRGGSA